MRGGRPIATRSLEHVVAWIREHGLPDSSSKSSVGRARAAAVDINTPFGPLLQTKELVKNDDSNIDIPFQHPMAMLWVVLDQSVEFRKEILRMLDATDSPLRIALYSDEITPGRELKPGNDRKSWLFYWSFIEFGPLVLSNEFAWFTGCCIRSSIVADLEGHMSQVINAFLDLCFGGEGSFDFRKRCDVRY